MCSLKIPLLAFARQAHPVECGAWAHKCTQSAKEHSKIQTKSEKTIKAAHCDEEGGGREEEAGKAIGKEGSEDKEDADISKQKICESE